MPLIVVRLTAAPKLMYRMETRTITEYVNIRSMIRDGLKTVTSSDSSDCSTIFALVVIST